ncbi:MAG: thiosulfate oxidation carrier complex protein SoxZ [Methylomonas sp.]
MSSIKIRIQRMENYTEVRLLITHPMENGRNRDPVSGELIPAHFIEELTLKLNDAVAVQVDIAGSIAKNPFFTFRLKNVQNGDRISAIWTDNRQQSDSADHIVNY